MKFIDTMITENVQAQMFQTGIYSNDSEVQRNAMIEQEAKRAARGFTSALNYCYAMKKAGKITTERYAQIRKQYDEANAQ